jgi:hypothetical protein
MIGVCQSFTNILAFWYIFYSNEHEPIHFHGRHAGHERRAEIILENGPFASNSAMCMGKPPLERPKRRDFEEFVEAKAEEIVQRWIQFFVQNIRIKPEIITRRVK